MDKRSVSERKIAEWMKAKKAVIGITTKEMALPAPGRSDRKVVEVTMQKVDLYVVCVWAGDTPSDDSKVFGAPEGSIEDVLKVAIKRYPMAKAETATVVTVEAAGDGSID